MTETPRGALLVPFPEVMAADDAPHACGVYFDAHGRFGIAVGAHRFAVNLDAAAAEALADALAELARQLKADERTAAAGADTNLHAIVAGGRC
ncbi:MAG: hypothetical protein R6V44_15240 [Paracoccaceae bacterium]